MTEFDDNRIALQDTEWTRMQIRTNELVRRLSGDSFVRSFVVAEEVRMTEETAMQVKTLSKADLVHTFGAAVGIPVTITDAIPPGKAQIWRDGEMIVEFDV